MNRVLKLQGLVGCALSLVDFETHASSKLGQFKLLLKVAPRRDMLRLLRQGAYNWCQPQIIGTVIVYSYEPWGDSGLWEVA